MFATGLARPSSRRIAVLTWLGVPLLVMAGRPATSAPARTAASTWGSACSPKGPMPDFPAPLGDYGDAPDDGFPTGYPVGSSVGHFPTRFHRPAGATGAFTVHTNLEWLGIKVSRERGSTDPHDPDGHPNLVFTGTKAHARPLRPDCDGNDDGKPFLSLGAPGRLGFSVLASIGRGAPDVPRYLNVVADINRDGRWNHGKGGVDEWVVRNCEFRIAPSAVRVLTRRIGCPVLLTASSAPTPIMQTRGTVVSDIKNPSYPPYLWFRVLLTRDPLPTSLNARSRAGLVLGWDGHGPPKGFPFGEVEDFFQSATKTATTTPTLPAGNAPVPSPTRPRTVFTPIVTSTPTPTPEPGPLQYIPLGVTSTYSIDESTGALRFCVEVTDPSFDGLFWDIEIPETVDVVSTGDLPPGWQWGGSNGRTRAHTSTAPLRVKVQVCFSLFVRPPAALPSPFYLDVSSKDGTILGSFATEPEATPTPTPTVTPTATETPIPQIESGDYRAVYQTFGGVYLNLGIDVTNPAWGGRIFRIACPVSAHGGDANNPEPPGWSITTTPTSFTAATTTNPILSGHEFVLQTEAARPPGGPLTCEIFDVQGHSLGSVVYMPSA